MKLSPVETVLLVGRRREIFKARHPEYRQGYYGKNRGKLADDPDAFVELESRRMGVSTRSIEMYLGLYTKIGERLLLACFNTDLDKYVKLKQLALASKTIRSRVAARARPRKETKELEIRP